MKTEKKQKKLGRPFNQEKTISVHCRIKPELYEKLKRYATKQNYFKGGKPNISKALVELAKNSLN